MNLQKAIEELLIQINKDENEGGLLSRETHRLAGNVRVAINRNPFAQGQRVNKVTGDYHIGGTVLAVFPLFPEQEQSPLRVAVLHRADEGFFVHIYSPANLVSTDRTTEHG